MNAEGNRVALADELIDAAYEVATGGDAFGIADHLIANRDAVLRALGLHEERAIDKPGMRGINPQRRWVTEWEDVTDE